MVNCMSDTEFLAKLHCLRLALEVSCFYNIDVGSHLTMQTVAIDDHTSSDIHFEMYILHMSSRLSVF